MLYIEKHVQQGLTLAHFEGRAVFVRGALPGERVRAHVVKESRDHIFAIVTAVVEASPDRVAQDCSIYPECGGCSFRHTDYAYELKQKLTLLREWKHIAPLCDEAVLYAARPNQYRSRARLQVRGGLPGFYAYRQNAFLTLPVAGCRQLPWDPQQVRSLARERKDGELRLRLEGNEVVIDDSGHFSQANYLLSSSWLATIKSQSGEAGSAVELFCGSGLIGRSVLLPATMLTGYDVSQAAIREARRLSSWTYMVHDLYNRPIDLEADLILANPPRAGLKRKLTTAINGSRAKKIVYSSCNPATLNRDLGELRNWRPVSLFVFDFFPRTHHLELLVCLERKS